MDMIALHMYIAVFPNLEFPIAFPILLRIPESQCSMWLLPVPMANPSGDAQGLCIAANNAELATDDTSYAEGHSGLHR
jgi:hypothetical protein